MHNFEYTISSLLFMFDKLKISYIIEDDWFKVLVTNPMLYLVLECQDFNMKGENYIQSFIIVTKGTIKDIDLIKLFISKFTCLGLLKNVTERLDNYFRDQNINFSIVPKYFYNNDNIPYMRNPNTYHPGSLTAEELEVYESYEFSFDNCEYLVYITNLCNDY